MSPVSTPPTGTSALIKRACDSCHRRKVKCERGTGDSAKPCKNCITSGLQCTYNAIPQKKGPKGSRAKVISELRETQRQNIPYLHDFSRFEPAWAKTPHLVNQELADHCADYYFANLYPTQPILHRQRLAEYFMAMEHTLEPYCFVTVFCAYMMMLQRNMPPPPGLDMYRAAAQPSNGAYGEALLEEAIRVRKNGTYTENPTILTVLTSYYMYECFFAIDRPNTAWFHLREATTHAHSLGMGDEESYRTLDPMETLQRRRLFWQLFITERAFALHKHRPLTLHATIHPPIEDEDPTDRISITGFCRLINLYRPFDDTFIGLWNKVQTTCLPSWLLELHKKLEDALPVYLENTNTETQVVDLRTSQIWLKTMVWQLSISHGFISSVASDNAMSFKYPIEISRDWIAMSSHFRQQAMEVHGVGLIEKLFDVACTLTDVLSYVPLDYAQSINPSYDPSFGASPPSPRDFLTRYYTIISNLRANSPRYTTVLMEKINDMLPDMTNQLSLASALPGSAPHSAGGYAPNPPQPPDLPSSHHSAHPSQHHPPGPTPPLYSDPGAAITGTSGMPPPAPTQGGHHNVNVSVSLSQYTGGPNDIKPAHRQDYPPQQAQQQQPQQQQQQQQHQQQQRDYAQYTSPHTPTHPSSFAYPAVTTSIPVYADSGGGVAPGIAGVGVTVGVSGPGTGSGLYGGASGQAGGSGGGGGGYD
ncbi:hypothetical protein EJ05DRAFT_66720 [Pseudovirgaria hyperparasitica]|uniref:Zn(2)-C6 fungal-type domain-containing protein n=1 Tax=Pseudovirgaria hyperparasitica TaxID=470096 RepID=A0A6A6W0S6_9PEZI|nr:uncharacterized protein EJ05DRAFT_66720 [Pseudovirgaria hyperparasitica]KAF2756518.1 hypothetical protein EJ05DRAFT_66720 [Pseudovirgaria hyperparasitica]